MRITMSPLVGSIVPEGVHCPLEESVPVPALRASCCRAATVRLACGWRIAARLLSLLALLALPAAAMARQAAALWPNDAHLAAKVTLHLEKSPLSRVLAEL